MLKLSSKQAEDFYGEHKGKPFYEPLITFMTSAPIVATVWDGEGAIGIARAAMGTTELDGGGGWNIEARIWDQQPPLQCGSTGPDSFGLGRAVKSGFSLSRKTFIRTKTTIGRFKLWLIQKNIIPPHDATPGARIGNDSELPEVVEVRPMRNAPHSSSRLSGVRLL